MNMTAKRLKEIRNTLDIKAIDMAEKINTSYSSYSNYERGENPISEKALIALVNEFNININWLLTGNGSMFDKQKNTLEIKYEPCRDLLEGFGKRLNKIRVNADLLSREIAMLLDIKEDRYADLVVSKKQPTLEEIAKICENFDVTADWLLFGKE